MDRVGLDVPRAKDLLWRLEVIENRLRAVGRVDLCDEFTANTAFISTFFCDWDETDEGELFWDGLCDQLSSGDIYIDRVIGARKAVAKYLKESGHEV